MLINPQVLYKSQILFQVFPNPKQCQTLPAGVRPQNANTAQRCPSRTGEKKWNKQIHGMYKSKDASSGTNAPEQ